MTRHSLAMFTLLAFAACGGDTSKDGVGTATGSGTATGGGGGGGGTATGGGDSEGVGPSTWEPVAVGFELIGGIHEDNQLGPYTSTDVGSPFDLVPFVRVTLASIDYFGGSTDESCDMLALLEPDGGFPTDFDFMYPSVDDYPVTQMASYGAEVGWEDGADSASTAAYATWRGRLVFAEADDLCIGVVEGPESWTQAPGAVGTLPFEAFQGMTIGFQIGQHTDYLLSGWSTDTSGWEEYGDAMMGMYIGINHPDGTFHGEDWTSARFWEANDIIQPETSSNYLIPSTSKPNNLIIGSDLPPDYLNGQPRWYQDFPLMDFPALAD
ncbi:MAG: hypothetical protein ACI8PZ_000589 [Myxococcota bacterium]|jgi:hypothetical protein